jgi:hypothetical protein
MLIYFYLGNLEWQNCENCNEKIKELKEKIITQKNIPEILNTSIHKKLQHFALWRLFRNF